MENHYQCITKNIQKGFVKWMEGIELHAVKSDYKGN